MYFKPDHLDLETGKAYKIVLRNVDEIVHEFAAPELALHSFTRKVEITDESGEMIAEIFGGNITEVEIGAGHEVAMVHRSSPDRRKPAHAVFDRRTHGSRDGRHDHHQVSPGKEAVAARSIGSRRAAATRPTDGRITRERRRPRARRRPPHAAVNALPVSAAMKVGVVFLNFAASSEPPVALPAL